MNTTTVIATKRITRRKFGKTGREILIAEQGNTISVSVCDVIHADGAKHREVTTYPADSSMGYALTDDEYDIDMDAADAVASTARRYRMRIEF